MSHLFILVEKVANRNTVKKNCFFFKLLHIHFKQASTVWLALLYLNFISWSYFALRMQVQSHNSASVTSHFVKMTLFVCVKPSHLLLLRSEIYWTKEVQQKSSATDRQLSEHNVDNESSGKNVTPSVEQVVPLPQTNGCLHRNGGKCDIKLYFLNSFQPED